MTFEWKNDTLKCIIHVIDVDNWGPIVVYILTSVTSTPLQQESKSAKQHLERQSFWNSAYDNPESIFTVIQFVQ